MYVLPDISIISYFSSVIYFFCALYFSYVFCISFISFCVVDVAASRDLNDYVITEKWRDVEQALEGEANILPIWLAWGSSRAEVGIKIKI